MRGIGVDSVEIKRFAQWYTYSPRKLARIFSLQEINYCLSAPGKSAERFAVRFAAKEALLKALSAAGNNYPLLYICKNASITKNKQQVPSFELRNDLKKQLLKDNRIHVSLTHTQEYATAFVIIV